MSDNPLNDVQHLSRLAEHKAPVSFRLEIVQQGNQENHLTRLLCKYCFRDTFALRLYGK